MALPSSGSLSFSQINTELGRSASATISLNDAAVRALAGRSSGTISFSDLRGKSAGPVLLYNGTLTVGSYNDTKFGTIYGFSANYGALSPTALLGSTITLLAGGGVFSTWVSLTTAGTNTGGSTLQMSIDNGTWYTSNPKSANAWAFEHVALINQLVAKRGSTCNVRIR